MARNRTRSERRAAKHRHAIIIAPSDNSQHNLKAALGFQLIRLWMFDPRDSLTRLQVARRRLDNLPVTYRGSDYTAIF